MGAFGTTHDIRLFDHRVTKTYRSWSRGEPHREWLALELLHRYAPGLAPRPVANRLDAVTTVTEMLSTAEYDGTSSDVIHALAEARDWRRRVELDPVTPQRDRVLGLADGNLANCLWDGEQVRLVDFEDSGVSDRCFELADVMEHPSAFVDDRLDDAAFLDALALDEARLARLAEFRRLMAAFWLVLLLPGGAAHRRNPPGTLEHHAGRARALFNTAEHP